MELRDVLKSYGLSEKESEIYLALLPLGSATIQKIASHVNFPRTTVYNTINYLAIKGLVSKIISEGAAHYQAVNPQKMIDNLDEKKQLLNNVLPQLESMQKINVDLAIVEAYQGTQGVFTILSDVFRIKQQTFYFGSYSKSVTVLKHLPQQARTMRIDRQILANIVIDPYDEPIFHTKRYKAITKMRFHTGLIDFPCMIFIYGNKIAIYTVTGDLSGIIIQNQEISKAMHILFNMYWTSGTSIA